MYIYIRLYRQARQILDNKHPSRKSIATRRGVTRKMPREQLTRMMMMAIPGTDLQPEYIRISRRANKEGIFSSHPTQQACQGCLLDVARCLDRCETFQCDICFSFRVSRYRDADRVESTATCRPGVRRRFVFTSKNFHFARAQIANTETTLFSCSPHFELGELNQLSSSLLLHEKSLARLA